MGPLLTPLYKIIRKAENFVWDSEEKKAFQQLKAYIITFQTLVYTAQGDELRLELVQTGYHGTWSLWTRKKGDKLFKPYGFWTKRFPYSPNK